MIGHITYSAVNKGTSFISSTGATYVLMNNQTISRTSFPNLSVYWAIGSFGSTATEMVIPDISYCQLRGVDLGRGADPDRADRVSISGILPSGEQTGSFQAGQMLSHVHVSGTGASGFHGFGPNPICPTNQYTPCGPLTLTEVSSTNIPYYSPDHGANIHTSGTTANSFEVGGVTCFPYLCVAI
ncbi:MAG: hypothetical protein CBD94_01620 [Gammaproteobacteria bacterium TMED234]|nr:MAG: hypothetical protein CBD94_01620 [Gammaproteobacteria bacterium TMED234]|tara:strand:+ start:15667 stop:16218 length:552 start_codon:yes stop_codon:yes gene_type:complete